MLISHNESKSGMDSMISQNSFALMQSKPSQSLKKFTQHSNMFKPPATKFQNVAKAYAFNDYPVLSVNTKHHELVAVRLREIDQENLTLKAHLQKIISNKYNDNVHARMKTNAQFINRHCNSSMISKKKSTIGLNKERGYYRSRSVLSRAPDMGKSVVLPVISSPEKANLDRTQDYIDARNLYTNEDEEKKNMKSYYVVQGTTQDASSHYYDQKDDVIYSKNHKIKGKLFSIEICQDRKTEDVYIFGRDIMSTHLYMLVLKSAFIQKMFNTTNLNYEEIIKSLSLRNRRLILELELENDERDLQDLLHNTSGHPGHEIVEERSENDTESLGNHPDSRQTNLKVGPSIEHNIHATIEQNSDTRLSVKPRLIPDTLLENETRSTPTRKNQPPSTKRTVNNSLGYGNMSRNEERINSKSVSPEHPKKKLDDSMREYGSRRENSMTQRGDSETSRRENTSQDVAKKTDPLEKTVTTTSNNLSVYQNQFLRKGRRIDSGNSNTKGVDSRNLEQESVIIVENSGERTNTQETFQKPQPSQFSRATVDKEKSGQLSTYKQRTETETSGAREISRATTKREEVQVTKRASAGRNRVTESRRSEMSEVPGSSKREQESKEKKEKEEVKVSTKSSARGSELKSKRNQSQDEEYADDFEELDFDEDEN